MVRTSLECRDRGALLMFLQDSGEQKQRIPQEPLRDRDELKINL
jgi:hypothetical protein